jgi:uncharacterized OB-fold protein
MSERRTAVPPIIRTHDNVFWFEAAADGRLVIQKCASCGTLRHPPGPACPECRSFDWEAIDASGRARLHSWTVIHHPQDPAFEYPLAVGLVDLEEGTRLVADIQGVDHRDLEIGLELEVYLDQHAHDEVLPRLRPRSGQEGVAR